MIIGLTGGIGSGKTTVAELFEELGAPFVDADVVAHDVTKSGHVGLQKIVEQFGEGVLDQAKELDRASLRAIVFKDPEARTQLEGILHPIIRAEMDHRLSQFDAPYGFACIPLLVEGGRGKEFARILVVDTPEATQIERVKARDGSPDEVINGILAAQATRAERLAVADDVIVNDDGIEKLRQQVSELHQTYLQLAAK